MVLVSETHVKGNAPPCPPWYPIQARCWLEWVCSAPEARPECSPGRSLGFQCESNVSSLPEPNSAKLHRAEH
jgi:hypothetical protein